MTQPSGWYDDPQDPGQLRYWDGVLWTTHTTPKRSPTAESSAVGRAPDVSAYPAPASSGYDRPPSSFGYGAAPQTPWTSAGPTAPDGAPLADWWQRLLARLLDNVIVGVLVLLIGFPWVNGVVTTVTDFVGQALRDAQAGVQTVPDSTAFAEAVTGYIVPLTLLGVVVGVVYETFFLVRSGATPGKKALGITVRRVQRPGPLRLVEALRRQSIQQICAVLGLVPLVSLFASILQLLDVLWLLWDPRRQALHDKLADTLVVRVPRSR